LALLQPRSTGQTLRLHGEMSIRLPVKRPPSANLEEELHGQDLALEQAQQQPHLQQMQMQQHLQSLPAFHQQVLLHQQQIQQQADQEQDQQSIHIQAHVRLHRTEQVQQSRDLKILQATDPGDLLQEAAAAIACNAHPEAATHLSLKPLVRDAVLAHDLKAGWRMCDAGVQLEKLSPLASHVRHLCLGQMCLGLEGDADALVCALPGLQTLRLEHCKLKASVGPHLGADGQEVAAQECGLEVILKGLTSLTRVDLIGGSVGDEEDLLNAAAQASSMVSDVRMRFTKLPQLHLICEDLEGVDPGRSMSEWSLRQEAYHMWEPQPMRVKLRVKA